MPKQDKPITIYSCGIDFSLSETLLDHMNNADHIYGSKKLLALLPKHHAQETVIAANAKEQAKEILSLAKTKKILVLCSGDSLYHGFGSTLLKLAPPHKTDKLFNIIPNITAFQALCAKLSLAWQDAELFTAHFQEELPLRKLSGAQLAFIYGGTKFPAPLIAKEIIGFSPKQKKRPGVFAEELGTENERIVKAPLEKIAMLSAAPNSILVLLPFENKEKNSLIRQKEVGITLGLNDEIFLKENHLITPADCRAVILSRLQLEKKGVFWDLGAGSGAVGLEAAGLTDMQVFSVEKNEKRFEQIKKNKQNLGITNYTPILGDITDIVPTLPQADRIFIGGGGKNLPAILDSCIKYGKKNAIILVSCVTLETFHALYGYDKLTRIDLLKIDIGSEQEIAKKYQHFKQKNTLYLFIFKNQNQDCLCQ